MADVRALRREREEVTVDESPRSSGEPRVAGGDVPDFNLDVSTRSIVR